MTNKTYTYPSDLMLLVSSKKWVNIFKFWCSLLVSKTMQMLFSINLIPMVSSSIDYIVSIVWNYPTISTPKIYALSTVIYHKYYCWTTQQLHFSVSLKTQSPFSPTNTVRIASYWTCSDIYCNWWVNLMWGWWTGGHLSWSSTGCLMRWMR